MSEMFVVSKRRTAIDEAVQGLGLRYENNTKSIFTFEKTASDLMIMY